MADNNTDTTITGQERINPYLPDGSPNPEYLKTLGVSHELPKPKVDPYLPDGSPNQEYLNSISASPTTATLSTPARDEMIVAERVERFDTIRAENLRLENVANQQAERGTLERVKDATVKVGQDYVLKPGLTALEWFADKTSRLGLYQAVGDYDEEMRYLEEKGFDLEKLKAAAWGNDFQAYNPKAWTDEYRRQAEEMGITDRDLGVMAGELNVRQTERAWREMFSGTHKITNFLVNIPDAILPGNVIPDDFVSPENEIHGDKLFYSDLVQVWDLPTGGALSDHWEGPFSETGEGLKFQRGGLFDFTQTGAQMFAYDVFRDPVTYLSFVGAGSRITTAAGTRYLTRAGMARLGNISKSMLRTDGISWRVARMGRHDARTARLLAEMRNDGEFMAWAVGRLEDDLMLPPHWDPSDTEMVDKILYRNFIGADSPYRIPADLSMEFNERIRGWSRREAEITLMDEINTKPVREYVKTGELDEFGDPVYEERLVVRRDPGYVTDRGPHLSLPFLDEIPLSVQDDPIFQAAVRGAEFTNTTFRSSQSLRWAYDGLRRTARGFDGVRRWFNRTNTDDPLFKELYQNATAREAGERAMFQARLDGDPILSAIDMGTSMTGRNNVNKINWAVDMYNQYGEDITRWPNRDQWQFEQLTRDQLAVSWHVYDTYYRPMNEIDVSLGLTPGLERRGARLSSGEQDLMQRWSQVEGDLGFRDLDVSDGGLTQIDLEELGMEAYATPLTGSNEGKFVVRIRKVAEDGSVQEVTTLQGLLEEGYIPRDLFVRIDGDQGSLRVPVAGNDQMLYGNALLYGEAITSPYRDLNNKTGAVARALGAVANVGGARYYFNMSPADLDKALLRLAQESPDLADAIRLLPVDAAGRAYVPDQNLFIEMLNESRSLHDFDKEFPVLVPVSLDPRDVLRSRYDVQKTQETWTRFRNTVPRIFEGRAGDQANAVWRASQPVLDDLDRVEEIGAQILELRDNLELSRAEEKMRVVASRGEAALPPPPFSLVESSDEQLSRFLGRFEGAERTEAIRQLITGASTPEELWFLANTIATKYPNDFPRLRSLASRPGDLKTAEYTTPDGTRLELPESMVRDLEEMPHELRREIHPTVEAAVKAFDHVTRVFKTGVTAMWIPFHVRNWMSGAFFHMFEHGLNAWRSYPDALRIMSGKNLERTLTTATGERHTLGELAGFLERRGIGGSGSRAGRQIVESTVQQSDVVSEDAAKWRDLLDTWGLPTARKAVNLATIPFGVLTPSAGRAVGSKVEDWERIALFLNNVRRGDSLETAYSSMQRVLVDYDNLANWEKTWAKRGIPFYTWPRQAIPYVTAQTLERPGRALAMHKATDPTQSERDRLPTYAVRPGEVLVLGHGDQDVQVLQGVELPTSVLGFWDGLFNFGDEVRGSGVTGALSKLFDSTNPFWKLAATTAITTSATESGQIATLNRRDSGYLANTIATAYGRFAGEDAEEQFRRYYGIREEFTRDHERVWRVNGEFFNNSASAFILGRFLRAGDQILANARVDSPEDIGMLNIYYNVLNEAIENPLRQITGIRSESISTGQFSDARLQKLYEYRSQIQRMLVDAGVYDTFQLTGRNRRLYEPLNEDGSSSSAGAAPSR